MIIESGCDVVEVQWVSMMLLLLLDGGTIKATTWFTNFPSKLSHVAVISTFWFPLYQECDSKGMDLSLRHHFEKGPYIVKRTNESYTMQMLTMIGLDAPNTNPRAPTRHPKLNFET